MAATPLAAVPTTGLPDRSADVVSRRRLVAARGRMGDFRRYLLEQGLSERSVSQYVGLVRHLQVWCRRRGIDLETISADDLGRYVAGRPQSWSTRKGIRTAVAHYWMFRRRRDPPLWILRVPRKPRMVCRAVTDDLASEYAAAAAAAMPRREAMAMLLMLYQALRREEVARLRVDQFTEDGWLVVYGKAGSTDSIPVHPIIARALERYLAAREEWSPWLFPGQGCRAHVCPTTVWTWVRRLCEEAGLPVTRPHQLRHTALATANDRTGDLRAVQEFARHRRADTTSGYTRATASRLHKVVEALDYSG